MVHGNCEYCARFTNLHNMKVRVKKFLGFFWISSKYDPNGNEIILVCDACKTREENKYTTFK